MRHVSILLALALLLIGCNKNIVSYVPDENVASGSHILETHDNGLLLTGVDQKNGYHSRGWVNDGSGVVIKLDEKKQLVWKKQYPFLKYSNVHDLIESCNQDLLLVSPLRKNHQGGRGDENLSYLTRLSKDGTVIYQKEFLGVLMKLVEKANGETLVVGLNRIGYEESIKSFVFRPFIACVDQAGGVVWTKEIDDNVNWIDEAFLKEDGLHINATFIGSTFNLATTPNAVRKVYQLDQNGKMISSKESKVSTNEIGLIEEQLLVEFVKKRVSTKDTWMLQVKDEASGKTSVIDLGQYAELNLLPRLRLGYLHVCTQSSESYKALNQITVNQQGEAFISVAIVNDLNRKVDASLSTQAYCHNNVDGFLVVKLDKERELNWVRKLDVKAVPLNIERLKGGGVAIVGTLSTGSETIADSKKERLMFILLDKNGKQ